MLATNATPTIVGERQCETCLYGLQEGQRNSSIPTRASCEGACSAGSTETRASLRERNDGSLPRVRDEEREISKLERSLWAPCARTEEARAEGGSLAALYTGEGVEEWLAEEEVVGECSICMRDHEDPETRVIPHSCATCTSGPTAWKICTGCDKTMRSQRCPVCRCDYAPALMCRLLGCDDVEEALKPYAPLFATAVCESSTTILWSPSSNTLRFSIPVDVAIDTPLRMYRQTAIHPTPEAREELLQRGTFKLSNSVLRFLHGDCDGVLRQGRAATAWLYSRGGELSNEQLLGHNSRTSGQRPLTGEGDFFLADMSLEEQRQAIERMALHVEGMWSTDV
uniref:RING-type domain-containing protein n=1 Tax=Hemiselmis andersenii TaxID=464988 RepID=A0A6U4PM80_HEMAN